MDFKSLILTGLIVTAGINSATAGIFECCDPDCCAPACNAPQCCAPACSAPACSAPQCCVPTVEATCCVPSEIECTPSSCGTGCGEGCSSSRRNDSLFGWLGGCRSTDDCTEINRLICESKSGCEARDRREAIHKLGDRYDCCCHPHIMTAFVCALNDADDRVRAKAADEIGDQIRRRRVCVGPPVVRALKRSLRDCDRMVRRQAEQALRASGYKMTDGCCESYCPPVHSSIHQYDAPVPEGSLTPVPKDESSGPDGTADDPASDGPDDGVPAPPEAEVEELPELSPSAPTGTDSSSLPRSAPEWNDEPSDLFSPLPRKINKVSFLETLRDTKKDTPVDYLSTLVDTERR